MSSPLRFPVKPAPLWDRAFLTAFFVGFCGLWLVWPLLGRHLPPLPLPVDHVRLSASAVLAFVGALVATRAHRAPGGAIVLEDDRLRLPPAVTGGAPVEVRFEHVRRFELQGLRNHLALSISTQSRRHLVPAGRMETPDDFLDLLNTLLSLAEQVPPSERLRLLATVEMVLKAPPAPPPRVTQFLMGLCLAIGAYAAWGLEPSEFAQGALDEGLLFGGNQPFLVRDGQWFRLISANYLHGGVAHLAMNMMSLYAVGAGLERMLGRRALLALYLFSGLTGAAASSAFLGPRWSVGASTSLFGLVGALAVVHFRHRHTTLAHLLPSPDFWRNTLALNALLVVLSPNIDHLGHLGGLLGGALLALVLDVRPYQPEERPHRRLAVAAGLTAALHLAGLGAAFSRSAADREQDAYRWWTHVMASRGRR